MIMGNHTGQKLDYKQEEAEKVLNRAKAECVFTDQLYEILLAYQNGLPLDGRPPNVPEGNVGDLNFQMSRLYNLIWTAAMGMHDKARSKKKEKKEMEVNA
jgi:hypothetical protein